MKNSQADEKLIRPDSLRVVTYSLRRKEKVVPVILRDHICLIGVSFKIFSLRKMASV